MLTGVKAAYQKPGFIEYDSLRRVLLAASSGRVVFVAINASPYAHSCRSRIFSDAHNVAAKLKRLLGCSFETLGHSIVFPDSGGRLAVVIGWDGAEATWTSVLSWDGGMYVA